MTASKRAELELLTAAARREEGQLEQLSQDVAALRAQLERFEANALERSTSFKMARRRARGLLVVALLAGFALMQALMRLEVQHEKPAPRPPWLYLPSKYR